MNGKIIGGIIVFLSLIAGASMYYLQVYAYYTPAAAPAQGVMMTTFGGSQQRIVANDFEGIDADSSPIRYRACFQTSHSLAMLSETFQDYPNAEPLTSPGWFGCFDAEAIAADLSAGRALAFLGEKNVHYGVDRVIVVHQDGRAFAWNQLNDCGQKAYDGSPVGEACPPRNAGE
jgi:hypothetical protein